MATVGCPSCTDPIVIVPHPKKETCTHVLGSFVHTAKKSGELWARRPVLTPVPSQANHSSSRLHRFETGHTADKIARMYRLLGRCLETHLRKLTHMLANLVRVSQQQ